MPKKIHFIILGVMIIAGPQCAISSVTGPANGERPTPWAVHVERTGLPNLYRVSPGLYRGGQPTREGYASLKAMGIKTVINLRASDTEMHLVLEQGIGYFHIPLHASQPKREDFLRVLEIMTDQSKGPVFVHCLHGADRTGAAVALYRIRAQQWDREKALQEMVHGGYGFHWIFDNLIGFIRKF